jgi:hypothetical protein
MMWLLFSVSFGVILPAFFIFILCSRNLQYWLPGYLIQILSGRRNIKIYDKTIVYVCFADHYEPYGGGRDKHRAHEKVISWHEKYPMLASRHVDSYGYHPKHTFFYPIEEYDPEIIDKLGELERAGFAGVEVHYHHQDDTAEQLTTALRDYCRTLHQRHHLLRFDGDAMPAYCFIHGNWALDNSRPDGKWCGVDNELSVLVETGCRADFTLPSAPSDTQTQKINSIYAARGVEGKRKSHNTGRDIEVGQWLQPGELLLIQGPLALNWQRRKAGVLPKIENAEISFDCPPSPERVPLWMKYAPIVKGAEGHIFIKLHTHGAEDDTMNMLLGGGFERLWDHLEKQIRDQPGLKLRYVTAWEMFCKIRELSANNSQNAQNV